MEVKADSQCQSFEIVKKISASPSLDFSENVVISFTKSSSVELISGDMELVIINIYVLREDKEGEVFKSVMDIIANITATGENILVNIFIIDEQKYF